MSQDGLGRSVDAALVPMVASLRCWGVDEAHWLPDRDGAPVVWLRTSSRSQSRALESQPWLLPQVQVTLSRLGVPHDVVWHLRIELTSAEEESRLFDE